MNVRLVNGGEVFDDNNDGYLFGIYDTSDFPFYVEWFDTEEKRQECIKENHMVVV